MAGHNHPREVKEDAKLSGKQRLFCELYVTNGYSARSAYGKAYGVTDYSKLQNNPYVLLRQPNIKKYIEELRDMHMEEVRADSKRILEELSKIAFDDESKSNKDKISAMTLMSKILGLETINQNVNLSSDEGITINITGAENE